MIGRLVGLLGPLLVAFCIATLLAELLVGAWVWFQWKLDRNKLVRMLAVAQDIDLAALQQPAAAAPAEAGKEQPSYEELVAARAVRTRQLELREQAIQEGQDQLRLLVTQLAQQRTEIEQASEGFEKRLTEVGQGARTAGREEVVGMLSAIKPRQAKELLLDMLAQGEQDEIVLLLKEMQPIKRAKILGEFRAPEELQRMADVLRLIREGDPVAALVQPDDETSPTP